MPVEDRLRQGLEDNATSFSPQGEWRLEQVHHRRRRRTTAVATSVGALAVLLGTGLVQVVPWAPGSTPPSADDCSPVRGRTAPEEDTMDKRTIISAATVAVLASACDVAGGTTDEPRTDPRPTAPSSSAGAPRLPERGGWGRDATEEEGLALGVPRRIVERLVDRDDVVSLGMNFQHGILTLWTNDDDWEPSAWDLGSYEFEPGRRLVLTSMSDRCPGCTTTMTWRSINGDAVFDSVERGKSSALAKWLWEGRWDYNPPE